MLIKKNVEETSKLVLFSLIIFCITSANIVLIGWLKGKGSAEILFMWIILLLIFITSFYTWKAKGENIEKIKKRGVLSDNAIDTYSKSYGNDLACMGLGEQIIKKSSVSDDAVG